MLTHNCRDMEVECGKFGVVKKVLIFDVCAATKISDFLNG